MAKTDFQDVDGYIATFPAGTQQLLQQMRAIIQSAAPDAVEVISYQMPAYKAHGILVYFAAYAKHIGFYPTGSGMAAFQDRFGNYKTSKGAVQFPLDQPLPAALIAEIVRSRVAQDDEKFASKAPKNK